MIFSEKITKCLDIALEACEMGKDEIDEIVLVGGSTRLPWIH